MLCYVMLCYVMLCYVMLCYVMLYSLVDIMCISVRYDEINLNVLQKYTTSQRQALDQYGMINGINKLHSLILHL